MIKLEVRAYQYGMGEIVAQHSWAKDGSSCAEFRKRGNGGEYQPVIEATNVISLEADGEELIGLLDQFCDASIPRRAYNPRLEDDEQVKSMIWFGDMAKFIYANLDETLL